MFYSRRGSKLAKIHTVKERSAQGPKPNKPEFCDRSKSLKWDTSKCELNNTIQM